MLGTPIKPSPKVFTTLCIFLLLICTKAAHSSDGPQIDSLKVVLEQSLQAGENIATAHLQLGKAFTGMGQFTKALEQLEKAREAVDSKVSAKLLLDILNEQAFALMKVGKNKEGLNLFIQGKEMADALQLLDYKAEFLFSIGDYFRLQREVPTAISYLDQAGIIYSELGDEKAVCGKIKFTKAITYKVSDKDAEMKKSIEIYNEMLQDNCRQYFSGLLLAKVYSNLGACYIDVGDLAKAEENLLYALRLKKKYNRPVSRAYTLNELSSLYVKKSDHSKALEYAEEALRYAQEGEDIHLNMDILENLAVNHFNLDHQDEGFYYLQKSRDLNDSIQTRKYRETIAELEMQYESAQKDQEIIQKEFQLSAQENRLKLFALLSISLLILAIGLFLWYQNRLKSKELEARSLEKLDQMRQRYFTNISHELRTPLSLIVDPINRLKTSIDNPQQQALLQTASRNADRMLQLVNQMLDLSKLEAGKLPLQAQKSDLVSTLKLLVDSFQQAAHRKQIELSYLPDREMLEVYFDRDKLEKIIGNLLSNALKFTTAGGSVQLLVFKREKQAEIVVKDNGKGIPEEKLPLVFNRFYQVDDS
ncbi:MAG: tetratricopeptide repeat protein, partial [Bacteroidota bacterium]